MLNYNIKGTGLDISDELRTYVEKKLGSACKLIADDSTAHADVELQHLNEGRSGKYRAEFTVSCAHRIFRAEAWGSAAHEAIDIATDELSREVTSDKKKHKDIVRRGAARAKEFFRGWRDKA